MTVTGRKDLKSLVLPRFFFCAQNPRFFHWGPAPASSTSSSFQGSCAVHLFLWNYNNLYGQMTLVTVHTWAWISKSEYIYSIILPICIYIYIYDICLINNCQAKLQPMALKPHKTNQCKMFIEMIKHRVSHKHLDIVRNVYVECMTKCTLPPSVIVSCQTFWDLAISQYI